MNDNNNNKNVKEIGRYMKLKVYTKSDNCINIIVHDTRICIVCTYSVRYSVNYLFYFRNGSLIVQSQFVINFIARRKTDKEHSFNTMQYTF